MDKLGKCDETLAGQGLHNQKEMQKRRKQQTKEHEIHGKYYKCRRTGKYFYIYRVYKAAKFSCQYVRNIPHFTLVLVQI